MTAERRRLARVDLNYADKMLRTARMHLADPEYADAADAALDDAEAERARALVQLFLARRP